jgi:hypothetical protein
MMHVEEEQDKGKSPSSTSALWDAFNEARMNKSVAEYCEMSMDDLKEKCNGLRCLLASVKARMIRSSNCRSYNWNVKTKPARLSRKARFYEKLHETIERIEASIKIKENDAKENAERYRSDASARKIAGWWDESYIQEEKRRILGNHDESKQPAGKTDDDMTIDEGDE